MYKYYCEHSTSIIEIPMIENLIDIKNTIKKSHIDSALGTALHILRCIDEGQSTEEIMQSLDNNEQIGRASCRERVL